MSTKNIATSTLWQIASQITMAALSILSVKFIAIGLTKEMAGNYNSAYGFLQLFGILADFGLYAIAVREVAKAKDKSKVLGALIVLRTAILFGSLVAAIAIAWSIPSWRGTPLPLGITIAALVPFFTLMAGIVRTVFQVTYKMHYVFIAEVVQRIFTTGALGLFILAGVRGSNDLHIFHLFLFIGGIGAFILFFVSFVYANTLMPIRLNINTVLMKKILRSAIPYGVAFLCMALYRQLDVTLIAMLREDFETQNAYYGFVLRMVDMGYIIPTFLLNSTLPILSERDSKGEDTKPLLGKTLFTLLLIGSISLLFSALWSRPLVQLLTTDAYLSTAERAGSDTALLLLSVPIFLNGIIVYSFYTLLTKHAWRQLVATLLIGAMTSLILNLIFIPKHGFVGAAWTSIGIHILLAGMLLPQSIRTMPVQFTLSHLRQWFMFTASFGAILFLFRPLLTNEIATVIGLIGASVMMGVLLLLCGVHKQFMVKA